MKADKIWSNLSPDRACGAWGCIHACWDIARPEPWAKLMLASGNSHGMPWNAGWVHKVHKHSQISQDTTLNTTNQEYSEWLTWTCMYQYIYGFSYGLQCPISFGDITNGHGNKQVSIDAGIWKNICGFVLNVHGISQGGLKTLGEKSELSGAGGKYLEEYFPIYWCKQTEILSKHVFYLHPVHHCDNDHFAMLSWGIDLS